MKKIDGETREVIDAVVLAMRQTGHDEAAIADQIAMRFDLDDRQAREILHGPAQETSAQDESGFTSVMHLAEEEGANEEPAGFVGESCFAMRAWASKEACAKILRPILEESDLEVAGVFLSVLGPGDSQEGPDLTVFCLDTKGRIECIEVVPKVRPKRTAWLHEHIDSLLLLLGIDAGKLPDVYVIQICGEDPLGAGLPMYHVDQRVIETGEPYDNGQYTIIVNGQYTGDDAMGVLMKELRVEGMCQ